MTRRALLIGMPVWIVDRPSHSLAYVAGIFEESGWDCHVKDLNVKLFHRIDGEDIDDSFPFGLWYQGRHEILYNKYESGVEELLRWAYDDGNWSLIAFTVNNYNRYFSLKASSFFKRADPHIPILFGGPACFNIESSQSLFLEDGSPNIICRGEGRLRFRHF